MKSNLSKKFAVLIVGLSVSATAFAGVNNQSCPLSGDKQTSVNYQANISFADGEKKEGVVRVGLTGVKSGSVGEGINGQELAAAIQNTLSEYLKGSKVELVLLESKVVSTLDAEIKEKQCDFVMNATISHKKGGGGFGMFKTIAPVLTTVVPMAGVGAMIAGSVASTVINSTSASANVKPKDQLTLDVQINSASGGAQTFAKQFKAKAKSGGEDIITPMVEQAAQAIVDAVGK